MLFLVFMTRGLIYLLSAVSNENLVPKFNITIQYYNSRMLNSVRNSTVKVKTLYRLEESENF